MRIITRYVLAEFLLYFTLALFATSSILILRQIFLLTKQFVRKDVSLIYLFELVFYALPSVLALTVPMAVLAGMLMVLGQFAFTGEITAMRASGIGIHQLVLPVMVVGLGFAVIDYWLMDIALPWGNTQYLALRTDIGRQNPALILEDNTVMRDLEKYEFIWFYERTEPESGRLENVRVWQEYRDGLPRFLMAREGILGMQDGRGALTLFSGVSYEQSPQHNGDVTRNRFEKETIYLPIGENLERSQYNFKNYRAMSSRDLAVERRTLRERLAREKSDLVRANMERSLRRASVEWHKKFSIPFASLVFALVSVPLGVITKRSGFMVGMVIGLPLIIVYYTLLRVGETLGIQGSIPAALGPWLPNLPTLLLGVYMTIRMWRR